MCDFSQYGGRSEDWLAVEKTLPANTFDLSKDAVELKNIVNSTREEASAGVLKTLAPQLKIETYDIPTRDGSSIQARSYRPLSKPESEKLAVCLYFHGGGFIFGTLSGEDAACSSLALKSGIVVLNVNYRHTPEHIFPTAWLDAQDSFAWLHANISVPTINGDASKVVVGGVSAGGQLTASLVLEKHLGKSEVLKGLPEIAGQILIIPALATMTTYNDGPQKKMKSPEISSYKENENAPVLPLKTCEYFTSYLKIESPPAFNDTKLNIANATTEDAKGLPPTVFGIAGLDPLRDEGLLYAKTLAEAGVPTDIRLFKGVPHGFRRYGTALKASAEWDRAFEEGVLWAIGKPQATGKFDVKVVCE
ncbi:alpha/beta hydrolase fold-3 domain-containing protein [Massarina eburnea CBS 473.64]|uniref:Alpha/beta hydrolase fold-3 domain-containing protein n=1 Tax=Massarina eburnea CBS 473.64 TaxID=1395130 RepID=A0A6A6RWM7_9PLEO|nr:alpha/beta hydrolase fold-3 domain-containing protein [Massarina eburnea CBS 473.64]